MDLDKLQQLTLAEPSLKDAISKQDDSTIAAWWNEQVDSVSIPLTIPKNQFLLAIMMTPFRIAILPDPKQTAWRDVIAMIRSVDNIDVQAASSLVDQAIVDGVLTKEEAILLNTMGNRKGTRAEGIFGIGTIVSEADLNQMR